MKTLLTVMTIAMALLATPVAHSDVAETRATLRERMLRLINRDRATYGLPPVRLDVRASVLADAYCEAQIRNRTTGHFTTDGLAPYMRYSLGGGNDGMSENAAAWSADYAFNERALYEMLGRSQDAMMAEAPPDDGHRRTILDPHATHVGIGLAWEKGEFRLVQHFIRRHVDWTRTPPRHARPGETATIAGRPLPGSRVEAITVHHEPLPTAIPAHLASALDSYSLPEKRREYLPRRQAPRPDPLDRTMLRARRDRRGGTFSTGNDGAFSLDVPFNDGPGVYTVVVWVGRDAAQRPVAASNVSIRVEPIVQAEGAERGATGVSRR